MNKLFPFLKPYTTQLIIGPFFKLAEAVLEIFIPTLMAYIIDNGVNKADTGYILKTGLLMLAIATLGVIFAYICQYSASIASQGFGTDVRNALFEKVLSFSHAQVDEFGTASLINRITGDVNQLQSAVAMLIRLVIRAPFLCVGGLVMAMLIDLKLSVIFMVVIPLFVFVTFSIMTKAVPLYKTVQKRLDAIALVLRENLSGVRVIRAFAKAEYERYRFSEANQKYADNAINVGKIAALTNPATSLIMNFAVLAVIWFGGIRINAGNMTQGEIIAYINYIVQILNAMLIVSQLVVLYTKAYASALRVNEILSMDTDISDGAKSTAAAGNSFKIEFKNVSMKYSDSIENALENINFTAKAGEIIGIIGGTGSGKSTLVNLIPRFYDAAEGAVLVDGMDVRDYKLDALRDKIGIVPQRAVLFSGSVADNLRFAKETAKDSELAYAAEVAQAAEFIEKFEQKYDTIITQGGANLSGGQRQRLTIARALVKNPEILILDDSASALDYITDAKLWNALRESNDNRTLIIVSQRVRTVKNADKIIVLEDGRIEGIGTHEELFKNCVQYAEICRSQEEPV
ncbi:MAG: ABC transporter ATP-binding protein/permease [Clostridia bacterium]|nr:ABC transporter ATP-binding protein/permease [Clostridia bacterium]